MTVTEYERFIERGGYRNEALWSAGGFGEFPKPEGWDNQLRYPNRPVTDVSWWEAAA